MKVISLQSGSNGNCIYVETGGTRLLFDAGISGKWVCLAHLSQDNNTPHLALATHRRILGDRLPLLVAGRYEATDVLEV